MMQRVSRNAIGWRIATRAPNSERNAFFAWLQCRLRGMSKVDVLLLEKNLNTEAPILLSEWRDMTEGRRSESVAKQPVVTDHAEDGLSPTQRHRRAVNQAFWRLVANGCQNWREEPWMWNWIRPRLGAVDAASLLALSPEWIDAQDAAALYAEWRDTGEARYLHSTREFRRRA